MDAKSCNCTGSPIRDFFGLGPSVSLATGDSIFGSRTLSRTSIVRHLQQRLKSFDFEPAEFGYAGPLLYAFNIGSGFWGHFDPPVPVLAGSPERDSQRVIIHF